MEDRVDEKQLENRENPKEQKDEGTEGFVSYTKKVSKHGLGMAVDINPLYNPYVKTVSGRLNIEPANGSPYVDRTGEFPCKIDENDLCYKAFTSRGFSWGGSWRNSKDYQHFEVPTEVIRTWYPDYGT